MDRVQQFDTSTLAELRALLAACADMPDDAVVRVRTRFGANSYGSRIRSMAVTDVRPAPSEATR
jgi:hypothetical protein